jgi:hypothetical protein
MRSKQAWSVLGLGFLVACSSSTPLGAGDGGHDAPAGADHSVGAAGAGGAGTSGGAGKTGAAGSGIAGTTGVAGAAGAGAAGASGGAGAAGANVDGGAGATGAGGHQTVFEFATPANRDIDLLFMIDNSSSMQPLQRKLFAAFPAFIDALKGFPGGLPNLHVAVVSSSLGAGVETSVPRCPPGGDQGIFQTQPRGTTCATGALNPGQSFIITGGADGSNFTGDVSDVFSCIAALGDQGCGFEHQLASVLRALGADGAPAPVQNAGFLRASSFLQVVLLTNEDDCSAPPDTGLFSPSSMLVSDPLGPLQSYRCNEFGHLCGGHPPPRTPAGPTDLSGTCVSAEDGRLLRVADLVTALKKVKNTPAMIAVSTIAGPPTPYIVGTEPGFVQGETSPWPFIEHSCTATDGTFADPSVRLQQLTAAFGPNGRFDTICAVDLGKTLQAAAAQLEMLASSWPCLDAAASASTCTFVDHVRDGDGGIRDVALPSCALTNDVAPCWTLPASTSCASGRLVQFKRVSGAAVVGTTATCQRATARSRLVHGYDSTIRRRPLGRR